MKDNKGITLIALVITIIVLLILAGVSIAMLSGDNSLLGRAQSTVYTNEIAAGKDEVSIAYNAAYADYLESKYDSTTSTKKTFWECFDAELDKITQSDFTLTYTEITAGTSDTASAKVVVTSKSDTSKLAEGTVTYTSSTGSYSMAWGSIQ